MRVLHVINQFSGRAGAELSLRDIVLGTQSTDRGLQHGLAVLRHDVNRFEGLAEAEVPTYAPDARLRSTASRLRHVRRAISAFQPDLVHTTLFDANTAGRTAARLARVPTLTSLVNTPYAPEALWDRQVGPLKLRGVRAVDQVLSRHATTHFHAITDVVAEAAVATLRIERSAVTVIPRGRSLKRLGAPSPDRRQRTRRLLGLEAETPVLVNVARQEAQKGQAYLVEALATLRQRHPDIVLLLVGREGNRTAALERRIAELGVHGAVRRLGVRQDVGDLLCAADVFVFPSLYEGLGGAVLEAMALRVPIVASDAPALREVLADGACGVLTPVGDSAALARAISAVFDHPDGARERASNAYHRFRDRYELGRCVEAMRALYLQLYADTVATANAAGRA